MSLSQIVNVQITRQTKTVAQKGFGVQLILGYNLNSQNRVEYFTSDSLSSASGLFIGGTAAPEYKALQAAFSQNPQPITVAVGQAKGTRTVLDNAGTFTAGTIKGTIDGTLVSTAWATDKDTTMAAFATALQVALRAIITGDVTSTVVYTSGTHTIVITPLTGMCSFSIDTSAVMGTMTAAVSSAKTEAYDTALGAIQLVDDSWYGVSSITRTFADQKLIATWVESQMKFFVAAESTDDAINKTGSDLDDGSLMAWLKAQALARSMSIYHAIDTEYPDAALFGRLLPLDPGSYTGSFKTLSGITVDILTPTRSKNVHDKYGTTYEVVGGVNITDETHTGDGEFMDIIVFADWLISTIQANVFQTLVNTNKVPYTQGGIASIENQVTSALKQGQDLGGISPLDFASDGKTQIGGYYTSVPALGNIPSGDKAARVLNNVKFTAWLAGAIHATNISGIVIA